MLVLASNSLKDEWPHTCTHRYEVQGQRLYTWWTFSLFFLDSERWVLPTSTTAFHPHCCHLFQLLSRKGHVISPPGWLLVSSRRSSQRRIKQLLDWEGHPWYLQTSFWEDRLPLGIWPQLHLKCQEATDVLIHQISTSGLEAGLKHNEVSWGQRKKEEEILFSCSSSENILWAFCWQNTLTAKSRISQSR